MGCGSVLVEPNHLVPQVLGRQQCILWNRIFIKFYVKRAGSRERKFCHFVGSLEGRVWNRAVPTYSYDREENWDAFQVSKGKGSRDAFRANCQVERSPLNPDNVKGSLGISTQVSRRWREKTRLGTKHTSKEQKSQPWAWISWAENIGQGSQNES